MFVHRGEAQAFFDNNSYQSVEFIGQGLYQTHDHYLLICGEGYFEALTSVSTALAQLEVNEVINFGVCGALNSDLKKEEVHQIRSIYAYGQTTPLFKSFTTQDSHAKIDIISSLERVKSEELKKDLSVFAPLVDRELWAIAYACQNNKIPLRAYKIISDEVADDDFCQLVKDEAPLYSQKLFAAYQDKNLTQENQAELPAGFYFTFSQKSQFQSLAKKCQSLGIDFTLFIPPLLENEKNSKKRTQILLKQMREKINPLKKQMDEKLEKVFSPLIKIGVKVQPSKELEMSHFDFSFQIKDQTDLERLKKSLAIFDYKKYQDFINGDWDV